MKTTQLHFDVLEDRALLSASPMGAIAAPTPEPEAVEITVRKWEKISVPMTEEGQAMVVNKLRGVLNVNPDAGPGATNELPGIDFGALPPPPVGSDSLKYNFGGIEGAAETFPMLFSPDGHGDDGMLLPAVQKVADAGDDPSVGMLLPAVQKVR